MVEQRQHNTEYGLPGKMTSNNSAKISSPTYWTVYDLDTLTVDKEKTDIIRDKSKEKEESARVIFSYSLT